MGRRRILVTGSSGGLGSPLVCQLAMRHDIVQLDIAGPPNEEQAALGPVHVGSFADPSLVEQALDGVDAVIHCGGIPGAMNPLHEMVESNVLGTFIVLEAAGQSPSVEQFIYISSITCQGFHHPRECKHRPPRLPIDESIMGPAINPYAISKLQAEQWCRNYTRRYGKPVVALRSSWILRPPQYESFAVRQADPAKPHLHDYVSANDLIDGAARALDYHPPEGFEAFLMNAADQPTSTPSLDLAEQLFPGVTDIDRDKLAACDGFGAFVDCSRARERLGWCPEFKCKR